MNNNTTTNPIKETYCGGAEAIKQLQEIEKSILDALKDEGMRKLVINQLIGTLIIMRDTPQGNEVYIQYGNMVRIIFRTLKMVIHIVDDAMPELLGEFDSFMDNVEKMAEMASHVVVPEITLVNNQVVPKAEATLVQTLKAQYSTPAEAAPAK